MNRPMQPTRPAPAPGQAAAEAAADAHYQTKRVEAVTLGAGAALLAMIIGGTPARVDEAFSLAESFITEAEKRLGGKLPL